MRGKLGAFVLAPAFMIISIASCAAVPEEPRTPPELPSSRSFQMGFTYQPYDWSPEAFKETVRIIRDHGDLITYYFDDGVPWPEAFAGEPYHPNVEEEIQRRLDLKPQGHKVLLGLSPLWIDRRSLASYWGGEDGLDLGGRPALPEQWAHRTFADPEVATAYLNYCRDMIQRFAPDYFMYAAEVNSEFTDPHNPEFRAFLGFAKTIYTTLKQEYPSLPILLEFVLAEGKYDLAERTAVTEALLPYTDLIGISTYPYVIEAGEVRGDAEKMPADWFSRLQELAPGKRLAVVETGFNAEPVSYGGRTVPGNVRSQDQYVRFLLSEAQRLKFTFVSWWVPRDYDRLWKLMASSGVDEAFSSWRDTGLLDGDGKERPALKTWDAWLRLPTAHATP